MKNILLKVILIGMSIGLSACTNNAVRQVSQQPMPPRAYQPDQGTGETVSGTVSGALGGALVDSMDSLDREKLSHALDNPLGKSTRWTNQSSGVAYTVTPFAKVTVGSNTFCRRYTIAASQGDRRQQVNGTACVEESSGTWKAVH